MKEEILLKIINTVRNLREDGMVGGAAPTNNVGSGNIAGIKPGETPPVDLRKGKYKRLPLLYKDLFRRKKNV